MLKLVCFFLPRLSLSRTRDVQDVYLARRLPSFLVVFDLQSFPDSQGQLWRAKSAKSATGAFFGWSPKDSVKRSI